ALDLAGPYVLAADDEHVVGPAEEIIEAVGVAPEHVARPVPAVAHHLRRLLRQVVVTLHPHWAAHVEDALIGRWALAQRHLGAGERVAGGERWPGNAGRMRAKGDGAGFGRAVAVVDYRRREEGLDLVDERLGQRCRPHRHALDRGEVETGQQLALARDERQHGRDRGEPGDPEAGDRPRVVLRIEGGQKDE